MKKIILSILVWLCIFHNIYSQQFSTLGAGFNQEVKTLCYDSNNSVLYAGGNFNSSGILTLNNLGRWDGTTWDSIDNRLMNTVISIEKHNGLIYVGGVMYYCCDSIPINYNLIKLVLDSPYLVGNGADGPIYNLLSDTDLLVFGRFDSIGGIASNNVARFDGTNWYSYPTLDSLGSISCAAFFNGELYVGGNFDGPSGAGMHDIARFDGNQWQSVGGGLTGAMTFLHDIKVWNGDLYVGGYFNTGSGDPGNNIAKWNGTTWSNPGGGLGVSSASVWALEEYQGKLWAGGVFGVTNGGPFNILASWDGIQWQGSGLNITGSGILSLETGGNDLYVAGGNTNVNGTNVNCIFKYTGAVGIDETKQPSLQLTINPNPASDKLFIASKQSLAEDRRLSIFSLLGCEVKTVTLYANTLKAEADLTDLPSGIYYLKEPGTKNVGGAIRFTVLH